MASNLLTIKKHNDQLSIYQPYRTEWLDDQDAKLFKDYVSNNQSIEGFYFYSLSHGTETTVFYTPYCDLMPYIRYRMEKAGISGIKGDINSINIIEQ